MKLTIGWWKARDGSKWHLDWVGQYGAVGHSENELAACGWNHTGFCVTGSLATDDKNLIAPWTEPNLRPWKLEEVPPGIWVRNKSIPKVKMWVAAIGPDCVCVVGSTGETFRITFELLCNAYEYFVGGVIAWKPCGVEVPNE